MKFGHLLFPVLFFVILILGAVLIMRTVEEQSYVGANQTVYLDSSQKGVAVTAESVGSTREKAHQAFTRFADSLQERDTLSEKEKENLAQILKLGEAHWSSENWAPAFYAFERVLNDLRPLIDDGLGLEKATALEARFTEVSHAVTNEIVLVESTYLEAIETANLGYNALQEKDWISAIQSFAKAVDTLNLVKAQAAEIAARKLQEAYAALESGELNVSAELFNEVLAVYPDKKEAIQGLQLIQEDLVKSEAEPATPPAVVEDNEVKQPVESRELPSVPEALASVSPEVNQNPVVARADWHYARRELKQGLSLYLEAQSRNPGIKGVSEKITRIRKELQDEETIRLMDKAAILADLGQWPGVVKTYRQILNVDPVNIEARRGWENALVSLVGQAQVDQYKELIRHHLNAKQYSHARDTLAEARIVLDDRSDLDSLLLPLQLQLDNQQFPVSMVLESDGKTWVTIPGKMAPEQFKRKEITLFPGKLYLLGWRKGYEHRAVSLTFSRSDAPQSIQIMCNTETGNKDYLSVSGSERIEAALKAFDVAGQIKELNSFSAGLRLGGVQDGQLKSSNQIEAWENYLFIQLYAALSQQAEQEYNLIHLDARAHFIQVPDSLSRKESIELGQYLMSIE